MNAFKEELITGFHHLVKDAQKSINWNIFIDIEALNK